jgi:excinuclease ABC subunit C
VLENAVRNAELGLSHEKMLEEARRNQVAQTLDALREELALPRLPVRIECYDISNTMGTNSVASMVVFQGGRPAKDQYRRFKIKTVEGADDFASMAEVIRRRLERLEEEDEKFLPAPDLIVLDGGKGQLSAVVPVFDEMNVGEDLPDIPLRSLAKRDEEVFQPGRPEPVLLKRNSPSCTCSSGSATRPTASPTPTIARCAARAMTQSVLDDLPGHRPRAPKADPRPLRHPRRLPQRLPRELEAVPASPAASPARSTRGCTGRLGAQAIRLSSFGVQGGRGGGNLLRSQGVSPWGLRFVAPEASE